MKWKDISSYSLNNKDRSVSTVQTNIGGLTLTVTRSIFADPIDWVVRCEPLVREQRFGNGSLDDAKAAAVGLLREKVSAIADELKPINAQAVPRSDRDDAAPVA